VNVTKIIVVMRVCVCAFFSYGVGRHCSYSIVVVVRALHFIISSVHTAYMGFLCVW